MGDRTWLVEALAANSRVVNAFKIRHGGEGNGAKVHTVRERKLELWPVSKTEGGRVRKRAQKR